MGRPKKQAPAEAILCPDLTQPIPTPTPSPDTAVLADLITDLIARVTALEAKLVVKKPQPVCVETPAAS